MTVATCDRCGTAPPPNVRGLGGAIAAGWSRYEALKEDGETLYHVTVCRGCLTDAEEADASPISRLSEGR